MKSTVSCIKGIEKKVSPEEKKKKTLGREDMSLRRDREEAWSTNGL